MGIENTIFDQTAKRLGQCIDHLRRLNPNCVDKTTRAITPEKLQHVFKNYQGPIDVVRDFGQMSERAFNSVFFQWEHDVFKAERNSPHEKPSDKKPDQNDH